MREPLTCAAVAEALRHDNGRLYWLIQSGKARVGAVAGRIDRQGYVALEYRGHCLLGHRVVWMLGRGEWPAGMVDHIDGDRANNAPSNLRLCTNAQNQQNRKPSSATGFKGVVQIPGGQYQAQIARQYIGLFSTPEAAAHAYDAEAARRYGQFARLNFGESA